MVVVLSGGVGVSAGWVGVSDARHHRLHHCLTGGALARMCSQIRMCLPPEQVGQVALAVYTPGGHSGLATHG